MTVLVPDSASTVSFCVRKCAGICFATTHRETHSMENLRLCYWYVQQAEKCQYRLQKNPTEAERNAGRSTLCRPTLRALCIPQRQVHVQHRVRRDVVRGASTYQLRRDVIPTQHIDPTFGRGIPFVPLPGHLLMEFLGAARQSRGYVASSRSQRTSEVQRRTSP